MYTKPQSVASAAWYALSYCRASGYIPSQPHPQRQECTRFDRHYMPGIWRSWRHPGNLFFVHLAPSALWMEPEWYIQCGLLSGIDTENTPVRRLHIRRRSGYLLHDVPLIVWRSERYSDNPARTSPVRIPYPLQWSKCKGCNLLCGHPFRHRVYFPCSAPPFACGNPCSFLFPLKAYR